MATTMTAAASETDTETQTETGAAATAAAGGGRTAAGGAVQAGAAAAAAESRHGLAAGTELLLLWLLASGPEAGAELGLDAAELAALQLRWGPRYAEMQLLHSVSRQLTRPRLAELLRARVNAMSLTAGTPAELAAVARAVKALPDWVWADAAVQGDGAAPLAAPRAAGAAARPFDFLSGHAPSLASLDALLAGGGCPAAAPLNRAERRRREALEKKLK